MLQCKSINLLLLCAIIFLTCRYPCSSSSESFGYNWVNNWRVEVSQPSRSNGTIFLYIYRSSTLPPLGPAWAPVLYGQTYDGLLYFRRFQQQRSCVGPSATSKCTASSFTYGEFEGRVIVARPQCFNIRLLLVNFMRIKGCHAREPQRCGVPGSLGSPTCAPVCLGEQGPGRLGEQAPEVH